MWASHVGKPGSGEPMTLPPTFTRSAVGLFLLVTLGSLVGAGTPDMPDRLTGDVDVLPSRLVGERNGAAVYRKDLLTGVHTIDRVYRSMQGPVSITDFGFETSGPDGAPELLWLVGYKAVMTQPDGTTQAPREFMCHSNVMLDPAPYIRRFPSRLTGSGGRLFTLAQGQLTVELPQGFGIPIQTDNPVRMATQVLNHNIRDRSFGVRTRVSIDFIRDRDLEDSLIPVMPRGIQGAKALDEGATHFGLRPEEVDPHQHGVGCSLGEPAVKQRAHSVDPLGRKFTAFWVVKPGREVNHTRVTHWLNLPYDTTIHYISIHVHPYAESIELYDLTAKKSVYRANVRGVENGKIGIAEVEHFSSVEGLPLHRDHEYELISVYDNISGVDQDAMALMLLYLRVKDLYDFDFRPEKSTAEGL